jgi:hypothetical protein
MYIIYQDTLVGISDSLCQLGFVRSPEGKVNILQPGGVDSGTFIFILVLGALSI